MGLCAFLFPTNAKLFGTPDPLPTGKVAIASEFDVSNVALYVDVAPCACRCKHCQLHARRLAWQDPRRIGGLACIYGANVALEQCFEIVDGALLQLGCFI